MGKCAEEAGAQVLFRIWSLLGFRREDSCGCSQMEVEPNKTGLAPEGTQGHNQNAIASAYVRPLKHAQQCLLKSNNSQTAAHA